MGRRRSRPGVRRNYAPVLGSFALIMSFALLPAPILASGTVTGSGCSVSTVGYLNDLAREYERRTGVKVFVRGGGSAVGIEDLRSGAVDFAASCRPPVPSDPRYLSFIQVAWDALVFIVHPTNPVETISQAEIRSMYAGGMTRWSSLRGRDAPVRIFVSRAQRGLSGVEGSLKTLVLNGKEPVATPQTSFLASTAIVEQLVEQTPEGFAATGISSAQRRSVKVLRVNGVEPTFGNISRGAYPFKRPLFLLLPKDPRPEARRFVDFALSNEGQRFIRSRNIIPLRDVK